MKNSGAGHTGSAPPGIPSGTVNRKDAMVELKSSGGIRVGGLKLSGRVSRLWLPSLLTAACFFPATQAPPLPSSQAEVVPVSLCREHLSVRNHGTKARSVTVDNGRGWTKTVSARGRDTSTNLPFAATIVVMPAEGESVGVTNAGGPRAQVPRSGVACVRAMPAANPDSMVLDYTFGSATALGPRGDSPSFIGAILVTFAPGAARQDVDALIASRSLALIGGRRGPTAESDVWAFWMEDASDNLRTERLVEELRRSPLVKSALPFLAPR
jgi:hypothetical protein